MELNTNNSSGMMNGLPPLKKEDRKVGPIVGALVIILLIIVVTLYFFGKGLNTQNPTIQNTPVVTTPVVEQTAAVSSSSDIESIQANLDAQLQNVDYSF